MPNSPLRRQCVLLAMFHVKKMGPKPISVQESAASKIKNKLNSLSSHSFQHISVLSIFCILMLCSLSLIILDTSSFFKVSLKTNNRALARALELQKQRCRQLEMEILSLHKQNDILCFDLASKKYKQKRLVGLFKLIYRCCCQ